MIEVRSLAKSFDAKIDGKRARVIAVEDVSFVAHDGRITAMLGPNGAGKTTTLRIIGTLVRADRGLARVGDMAVQTDTRAPAYR